jgi:hypothetical protein
MKINFKGKRNYQLTSDGKQYTLSEKVKVKTGKKAGTYSYSPIGFYSKLEHVFERVMHLEISDSDAHSFAELFAAIRDTREMISTVLSENSKPSN